MGVQNEAGGAGPLQACSARSAAAHVIAPRFEGGASARRPRRRHAAIIDLPIMFGIMPPIMPMPGIMFIMPGIMFIMPGIMFIMPGIIMFGIMPMPGIMFIMPGIIMFGIMPPIMPIPPIIGIIMFGIMPPIMPMPGIMFIMPGIMPPIIGIMFIMFIIGIELIGIIMVAPSVRVGVSEDGCNWRRARQQS
ncbi:hypothetical protein [Sorangium sp. So ce388]|uniref:hypothetical protein n=1 Tax=Sorangium sp. So ce388 TaxID=3133309 RepID=UPI003F5CB67C